MKNALKISALILVVFLGSGCNSLKRLTGSHQTQGPTPPPPDIYSVTGTTSIDYQIIQPVRCADSSVTVRVKRPGEDWHECNKYEVKIDTAGVGGGGVWFRRQADATFDSNGNLIYLVLSNKPVAPTGTQYEITSMRISGGANDLY